MVGCGEGEDEFWIECIPFSFLEDFEPVDRGTALGRGDDLSSLGPEAEEDPSFGTLGVAVFGSEALGEHGEIFLRAEAHWTMLSLGEDTLCSKNKMQMSGLIDGMGR